MFGCGFGNGRNRFEWAVLDQFGGDARRRRNLNGRRTLNSLHKPLWVRTDAQAHKNEPDPRDDRPKKCRPEKVPQSFVLGNEEYNEGKTDHRGKLKSSKTGPLKHPSATMKLNVFAYRHLVRYGIDDRVKLQAATPAIIEPDLIIRTAIRTKHIYSSTLVLLKELGWRRLYARALCTQSSALLKANKPRCSENRGHAYNSSLYERAKLSGSSGRFPAASVYIIRRWKWPSSSNSIQTFTTAPTCIFICRTAEINAQCGMHNKIALRVLQPMTDLAYAFGR